MKLKCDQHNRRVHVFPSSTVHRQDGSKCKSKTLTIGEYIRYRVDMEVGHDPEKELLISIFGVQGGGD